MYKNGLRYLLCHFVTAAILFLTAACEDDFEKKYDYTLTAEDVTLSVPISIPEIDTKSRADLTQSQENAVSNVWVKTYSANTGLGTSDWVKKENINSTDTEVPRSIDITSKSGNSYIVAVANVDNYGIQIKTGTRDKLRVLLEAADTWEDFLGIAVETPSTWEDVRLPYETNPMPMAGSFCNVPIKGVHPADLANWQNANFTPVFIPASSTGTVTLGDNGKDGAIHLRRVVSHIKFEIYAGKNVIELTPQSYKVANAPVATWLYERAENATANLPANINKANYGDNCTEETKDNFFKTPSQYTTIHFSNSTYTENGTTYNGKCFDFWQGENKHYGSSTTYNEREKEVKNTADGSNTGIYTSLCGPSGSWSSNNMASYVVINCDIRYKGKLNVDDEGNDVAADTEGSVTVERTATVNYVVHLGYLEGNTEETKSKDFNSYRNVNYTYRMFVDGVNQVRLEAFATDGKEPYPGAEGLVSDVTNPTYNMDCHNGAFTVYFEDGELKPYDTSNNQGFGFIIKTYEDGEPFTIEESDVINMTADEYENWLVTPGKEEKTNSEYLTWVELRPSTAANVIMPYKPRTVDNDTYYLSDISRGKKGNRAISLGRGYYTVFVKEYTYEDNTGDETPKDGAKPRWRGYVNELPRQFFMRVTRAISNDGESVYARSKYAASQKSIGTYYSDQDFTANGTAVGVEHDNESFGISLRKSSESWTPSSVNGRYNSWEWIKSKSNGRRTWSSVLTTNAAGNYTALVIPKVTNAQGNLPERSVYLPMLTPFSGQLSSTEPSGSNQVTDIDPQNTTQLVGNRNIEAINACMNRNRDDNGNGIIDLQELKWYVPTSGKYLRLILGRRSLEEPIMDYNEINNLVFKELTDKNGNKYTTNGSASRYLFYCSDGKILWAMEGLSMSGWNQWGIYDPGAPWQVRCVRNLGTNLANEAYVQNNDSEDGVQMAYVVGLDNVVNMNYYGVTSLRDYTLTQNGSVAASTTSPSIMPPHVITSDYNNPYQAFQYSKGRYTMSGSGNEAGKTFAYDIVYSGDNALNNFISALPNNPCSAIDGTTSGFNATGWRVPNQKELTIMRNLGLIDAINGTQYVDRYYSTNNYIVSSTLGYFNSKGESYKPAASNPLADRKYLGARYGAATQLGGSTITYLFIRCVRDVPRNVQP